MKLGTPTEVLMGAWFVASVAWMLALIKIEKDKKEKSHE